MTAIKLTAGKVHDLALGKISADPDQPRKHFPKEGLQMLADSIKTDGVLQPIMVRVVKGKIIIVAGERRWRASKLAGKKTIPAILDTGSDDAIARGLRQVAENEIREGLNHMELAEILVRMRTQEHKSDTEIAKALEKHGMQHVSRSGIANYLRLVELPDWAKDMIRNGQLTGSHGKYILQAVGLPGDILKNVKRQIDEDLKWKGELTVKDVEEAVGNEIHNEGIDLNAQWGVVRLFKLKVCKGCEFYRKHDGTEYCFNQAEFNRKNDEARELLKKDPEAAKAVATPAALKKADGQDEYAVERKERMAETREAGRMERIAQLLEDCLRTHILEQLLPSIDDADYFERLAMYLACGMPVSRSASYIELMADGYGGTGGIDDNQEDACKDIKRIKLQDFLAKPIDGEEVKRVAVACVRAMNRDLIHILARDLQVQLAPIFRISEEYLEILSKAQLEKLAKVAQLPTIAGWTGKKIKAELLKPENVERIGVPADAAKLYKGPVSQETKAAA